jgi:hypothetical protein
VDSTDVNAFWTVFEHDLESGFSAGIACCDACFDEFVGGWPAIYLRDLEFQKSGIGLEVFYSNSRHVQEIYEIDEYRELISQVLCPNCDTLLSGNIWPYVFPFDVPENFEENTLEIARIASTRPFLILTNPFAKTVLNTIEREALDCHVVQLQHPYYRGRSASSVPTPQIGDFDRPPNHLTLEGRYNHAGLPCLYLTSDADTCSLEMRGERLHAAKIQLVRPLKVLDLTRTEFRYTEGIDVLTAVVFSSLVSAPREADGWHRPQYVFSRFVADCARQASFDAIKYATTRASSGHNLAIINPEFGLTEVGKVISIEPIEARKGRHRD